jgi:hypothetical protein
LAKLHFNALPAIWAEIINTGLRLIAFRIHAACSTPFWFSSATTSVTSQTWSVRLCKHRSVALYVRLWRKEIRSRGPSGIF